MTTTEKNLNPRTVSERERRDLLYIFNLYKEMASDFGSRNMSSPWSMTYDGSEDKGAFMSDAIHDMANDASEFVHDEYWRLFTPKAESFLDFAYDNEMAYRAMRQAKIANLPVPAAESLLDDWILGLSTANTRFGTMAINFDSHLSEKTEEEAWTETLNDVITEFMGDGTKRSFDSDWNALFMAIDKIETIMDRRYSFITAMDGAYVCDHEADRQIVGEGGDDRLDSAYRAVLMFVRIYNGEDGYA